MIIVRSPLRISLGGGGTDLPSYYRDHGGFLIAAAINKYVYVSAMKPFTPGIFLKYSELEQLTQVQDIRHPIIRETLLHLEHAEKQIEITTLADIPSGTGLGSSGSFTTALIKAVSNHYMRHIQPQQLAELACHIEIDRLKEPIGKQDQYIAAVGGITCFTFNRDDTVTIEPLAISQDTLIDLEDRLLLFFTGFSRKAGSILEHQKTQTQNNDGEMIENLHYTKEIGLKSRLFLESGETDKFGALLHEHWEHKKSRSQGMSNPQIDHWYQIARDNGAIGGKLVGAGGGGFLMFYAEDHNRLRHVMRDAGLTEVRFGFDFDGTKAILT